MTGRNLQPAGDPRARPKLLAGVVAVLLGLVIIAALQLSFTAWTDAYPVVAVAMFVTPGCVMLLKARWNNIGWLLLASGFFFLLTDDFWAGLVPAAEPWIASLEAWTGQAFLACLAAIAIVFPGGHLPDGGRWAAAGRAAAQLLPFWILMSALVGRVPGDEVVVPYGFLPGWVWVAAFIAVLVTLGAGAVSLVVRFRSSAGELRAQLAWVVSAVGMIAVSVIATLVGLVAYQSLGRGELSDDIWLVAAFAYLTLPVAIMVAIVKYRLYEIDRLVSRTVGYTLVVVLLAGVYATGVLLLGGLTGAHGDLAVATSTLLVAALFTPVRRRVQHRVDRRFNRTTYDAQRELELFSTRLRGKVGLDELTGDLVAVVGSTMQPTTSSVWVREGPS